ncbi:Hypothetical protein A7982_07404 [Minicystis rosea]|nr:Hypothetical protein A7982_07404 [Minicystis rosea]
MQKHTLNAGASFVAGRATLFTVVGDAILERGDQSKPYRYVPMFMPGTGASVPVGASFDVVNSMRTYERPLEQLPLSRDRFALTGRFAHRFSSSTLRFEERLYADTWGLKASTSDAQYLFDIGDRLSLAPHLRAHLQTGATFWQRAYEVVALPGGIYAPPSIRTGDRELGPLRSFTGGLGLHYDLSERAGARAWLLKLQTDGVFTSYLDALYIKQRNAFFAALSLEAAFE